MKLTAKRAIKLDMDMWEWFSKNHGVKSDYPYFEKYKIGEMKCQCPCCEKWIENDYCMGCPLRNKKYCHGGDGAYFDEWTENLNNDKELHGALMIYRQLARAYKKLDKTSGA
jgi:hypothetical protein